ncbi:MAG: hypothetical protein IPP48_06370 [Chitinophagaceae bacterium]|nr:hypothetical protein [Chitinophagaceae bacterium]
MSNQKRFWKYKSKQSKLHENKNYDILRFIICPPEAEIVKPKIMVDTCKLSNRKVAKMFWNKKSVCVKPKRATKSANCFLLYVVRFRDFSQLFFLCQGLFSVVFSNDLSKSPPEKMQIKKQMNKKQTKSKIDVC